MNKDIGFGFIRLLPSEKPVILVKTKLSTVFTEYRDLGFLQRR